MKRLAALLCALVALLAAPAWATTPVFEAAPAGFTNGGPAVTSVSYTPTGGGFASSNVVMAVIVSQDATNARTVSSVTSTGCTFSKRSSKAFAVTGIKMNAEVWTCPISGTFTAAVQATMSGSTDSMSLYVAGVEHVFNNAAPFDSNGGLPVVTTASTAALTAPVFSTTQAHDLVFVLGFDAVNATPPTPTTVAWTLLDSALNTNGSSNNTRFTIFSEGVSVTQSSVTSDIAGTSSNWIVSTDAFTGDNNAGASVSNQGMTLRGMQ